jgi:hypothetical protein
MYAQLNECPPAHIYRNNLYEVAVWEEARTTEAWPGMLWLSIKRMDQEPIMDWRHVQRIKNEIVGRENEAIQLFPAESRLVDASNQYHLFVLKSNKLRIPVGFEGRLVTTAQDCKSFPTAEQRPFDDTHEQPDDDKTAEEVDAIVQEAAVNNALFRQTRMK